MDKGKNQVELQTFPVRSMSMARRAELKCSL